MKGIAISTLFSFVLAVVSIIILILFIGTNVSPTVKKSYCDFLRGFGGLLPLPEYAKPSLPSYCTAAAKYTQVIVIETENSDKIAYEIAAHSLACWKTTGEMNVGQNSNCYELILKGVSDQVTKEKVIANLDEDYKGKIDWQAGIITTPKSIGIYYNSTSKLIVVV